MAINMDDPLIVVGFVTIITGYVTSFFFFIQRSRDKREENKKRFFKALLEGLKSNSVAAIDDVVNVYKGVFQLSSEESNYRYSLSKLIREFLVDVISKNKNTLVSDIDDKTIVEWKQKLSDFIQKNEESSPYDDLPPAERNALNDLSIFLEKNERESVKRKIMELAGMIQARNDDLNKIRSTNKWSVPLSIMGIILTVIFGILALK